MPSNPVDPDKIAINLCADWATTVRRLIPCDVYLFGSVIYRKGDQFDPRTSDLDLVVVLRDEPDAVERWRLIQKLKPLKAQLELDLIPALERTECVEPGVSVVVLTQYELRGNVHKSAVRRFFDRNFFLDLQTPDTLPALGLPTAGTAVLPDENRHALEFAQKRRNAYLSIGANGTGGIKPYDGGDPLPKELTRAAAQLCRDVPNGEWYDTRHGLEAMYKRLELVEDSDVQLIFENVSKRRGARGQAHALSAEDQLILAEILADWASDVAPEDIVRWHIRFSGNGATYENREELVKLLRRLAPEAEILNVAPGSVVVELKSSQTSLALFQRLELHNALGAIFDVESVEVSVTPFDGGSLVERLIAKLRSWSPKDEWSNQKLEAELGKWMEEHISTLEPPHFIVSDKAIRGTGRSSIPADFMVTSGSEATTETVFIEVTRSSATLHRRLESLWDLDVEAVIVLVGGNDEARRLASRLDELGALVRLVVVTER